MRTLLLALALAFVVSGAVIASAAIFTAHAGLPGSVGFLSSLLGFGAGYRAWFLYMRSRSRIGRGEGGRPAGAADSSRPAGIRSRREGAEAILEWESDPTWLGLWFPFGLAMNAPAVILVLFVPVVCGRIIDHGATDWNELLAGAAIMMDGLAAAPLIMVAPFTVPGTFTRIALSIDSRRILVRSRGLLWSRSREILVADVRGVDVVGDLVIKSRKAGDLPIPSRRTHAEQQWLAGEVRGLLPNPTITIPRGGPSPAEC